jgi:hypothetical protein
MVFVRSNVPCERRRSDLRVAAAPTDLGSLSNTPKQADDSSKTSSAYLQTAGALSHESPARLAHDNAALRLGRMIRVATFDTLVRAPPSQCNHKSQNFVRAAMYRTNDGPIPRAVSHHALLAYSFVLYGVVSLGLLCPGLM